MNYNCKQCINSAFRGTTKCANFTADTDGACTHFLTLISFHQHIVAATSPENQEAIADVLEKQRQAIAKKKRTQ